MEDLMLAVLGYILIIGIAYAPQWPKAINQLVTESIIKEKKKVGRKKYINPNQLEIGFNALNSPSKLHDKTIRQLKKIQVVFLYTMVETIILFSTVRLFCWNPILRWQQLSRGFFNLMTNVQRQPTKDNAP